MVFHNQTFISLIFITAQIQDHNLPVPTRIYSQTLIAAIIFLSFRVKGECVTVENRNTPSHASRRQKIINVSNYTDATRIAAKTSSMLLLSICFKNTTVGDDEVTQQQVQFEHRQLPSLQNAHLEIHASYSFGNQFLPHLQDMSLVGLFSLLFSFFSEHFKDHDSFLSCIDLKSTDKHKDFQ